MEAGKDGNGLHFWGGNCGRPAVGVRPLEMESPGFAGMEPASGAQKG